MPVPLPLCARKVTLPTLTLTEVVEPKDLNGSETLVSDHSAINSYFTRLRGARESTISLDLELRENNPFNLFPVVLDSQGSPWPEANLYLLSRVKNCASPDMTTYSNIAGDLAEYLRFLNSIGTEWCSFPSFKLRRPTYMFDAHLARECQARRIKESTARRHISSVVGFYRWCQNEGGFKPDHAPWKESDRYLAFFDTVGTQVSTKIATYDLGVRTAVQADPYSEMIYDGEDLRPLPPDEQGWLLRALLREGNTEMTLMHLFGLLTGARLQTIGTLQVHHTQLQYAINALDPIRLPIGLGTGIDTKYGKKMVLHIPAWFFKMLRTYALSERARRRRTLAVGGDNPFQYLFLSVKGAPVYESKASRAQFDKDKKLRHIKNGQAVRQFIKDRIFPFVREVSEADFYYRFHDMRATYGMTLTDHQLALVARGEITLHQAREFVKTMMGHESSATTDLYLNYRARLKFVRQVGDDYHVHLRQLCESAMAKLD